LNASFSRTRIREAVATPAYNEVILGKSLTMRLYYGNVRFPHAFGENGLTTLDPHGSMFGETSAKFMLIFIVPSSCGWKILSLLWENDASMVHRPAMSS
jgi:hypothetical protein